MGVIFFAVIIKQRTSQKPLNLILISVDTLRPDHMGIYGYSRNTTPNIDKWAKNATVFTNAYTIFPLTFQSFYTLFTGKDTVLQNRNFQSAGSVRSSNDLSSPTLPMILKSQGYTTVAFVTNPVIDPLGMSVFRDGFMNFQSFDKTKQSQSILDAVQQNDLEKSGLLFYQIFKEDYYNSQEATAESINWIKNNRNNPFFLWVHYSDPHEPYNPGREALCKIDKERCGEEVYNKLLLESIPRCINNPQPKDENTIEGLKSLYDAEINSLDIEIGKLLKTISESDFENNTVVVFYADHGESFTPDILSHGYSLYNAEVKIPLIIKLPDKLNSSGTNNSLIDNTDILPTILNILNIKHDPNMFTGLSFVDDKYRWKENTKNFVYLMNPIDWSNKYGITDGKTKYIISNKNTCLTAGKEEFYNLQIDANEKNNLMQDNKNSSSNLRKMLLDKFLMESNTQELEDIKSIGY